MNPVNVDKELLQQVLQLIRKPGFDIKSVTYLDLLAKHVNTEVKTGDKAIQEILTEWFEEAMNTWTSDNKPSANISIFIVKLLGILCSEEVILLRFNKHKTIDKALIIFNYKNVNMSASMKMAYLHFYVSLLNHESGMQWIYTEKIWKQVLMIAQSNHTIYVTNECQHFLSTILINRCSDKPFCKEIIITMSEPFIEATTAAMSNADITFGDHMCLDKNKLLITTMNLLIAVMEHSAFYDLENTIPEQLEEILDLEKRARGLLQACISTSLMKTAHKLCKIIIFAKLRNAMKKPENSEEVSEEVLQEFSDSLCSNSTLLLNKKFLIELINSKKMGIIYWNRLYKIKKIKGATPYKFEDQAMTLLILPLCAATKPEYKLAHSLFVDYINKIFHVTCTSVQRLGYNIREVLMKEPVPVEKICITSIENALEVINIIDRETAVLAFQAICHTLKNFIMESKTKGEDGKNDDTEKICCKDHPEDCPLFDFLPKKVKKGVKPMKHFLDGDPIVEKPLLLAALLKGMNTFIEKFKLNWKECVETVCILSIALDILDYPGVDSRVCVLALKTCQIAIENFMSPNLVLLVDSDDETKQLGPTLFKRIHDTRWEVQDSAFELLGTIAKLSEMKYPPFQRFIHENNFIPVAIEVIKSETESYTRAAALSFLSKSIGVTYLWTRQLEKLDLPELAIKLITTEKEGIVRREAVSLLTNLYKHKIWPNEMVTCMAQTMAIAAVNDLHWEVKLNALLFWRLFMKNCLTDQGMQDDCFPPNLFCKEVRKIIILNEDEIKRRLTKTLDLLASHCCLGVLLTTLHDQSDFEVTKLAAMVIIELRTILTRYKIDAPIETKPEEIIPIIEKLEVKSNTRKGLDEREMDAVIDDIILTSDTNLLPTLSSQPEEQDIAEIEKNNKKVLAELALVDRKKFLQEIMPFDFDSYIKKKSEWLKTYTSSFNSVLEDIITLSDNDDMNVMDCY
ncbi:hypothetical protein TKK_0000077 [Trichogramma kaykai]|uniref:BRCA1-associated ATM activator 1 n=1 Tax=Trichogramma kaykai TaxID=54128 RepID=A0ABD2VUC1_9HYME